LTVYDIGMTECHTPKIAVIAMDRRTNGFIAGLVLMVAVEGEEKEVEF